MFYLKLHSTLPWRPYLQHTLHLVSIGVVYWSSWIYRAGEGEGVGVMPCNFNNRCTYLISSINNIMSQWVYAHLTSYTSFINFWYGLHNLSTLSFWSSPVWSRETHGIPVLSLGTDFVIFVKIKKIWLSSSSSSS